MLVNLNLYLSALEVLYLKYVKNLSWNILSWSKDRLVAHVLAKIIGRFTDSQSCICFRIGAN